MICLIYLLTTANVKPTTKPKFNAPNHKAIFLLDLFNFVFSLKFYQQNSLLFLFKVFIWFVSSSYWTNESNFLFFRILCIFRWWKGNIDSKFHWSKCFPLVLTTVSCVLIYIEIDLMYRNRFNVQTKWEYWKVGNVSFYVLNMSFYVSNMELFRKWSLRAWLWLRESINVEGGLISW